MGFMIKQYHVIARSSGGWSVKRTGAAKVSKTFATKNAAISNARKLAVSSGGAEVIVHAKDGRVSTRVDVIPPTNGNGGVNTRH